MGKTRPADGDALLAGAGRGDGLLARTDGMGGYGVGEVASLLAGAALGKLRPYDPLRRDHPPGRAGPTDTSKTVAMKMHKPTQEYS